MFAIEKSRFVGVSAKDLDEFTCGICQDIFVEPIVTPCCLQIFCKLCIYRWLDLNSVCPNDRKSLTIEELTTPPRLVSNLLNNMKVKCDYYSDGCKIIITLEELSKHIQICDKNPHRICITCGMKMDNREEHNCITNLIIRNSSNTMEIQKLRKENLELKTKLDKIDNGDITYKNMESTIRLARDCLNDVVVSQMVQMNPEDKQICIDISKHAITNYDSYLMIAKYLTNYWKINDSSRQWYAIVFANNGGESWIISNEYIQLRFGRLFIELFTSKRNQQGE